MWGPHIFHPNTHKICLSIMERKLGKESLMVKWQKAHGRSPVASFFFFFLFFSYVFLSNVAFLFLIYFFLLISRCGALFLFFFSYGFLGNIASSSFFFSFDFLGVALCVCVSFCLTRNDFFLFLNLGDFFFWGCLSLFYFNWALFFNKSILVNLHNFFFIFPLFHFQYNKNKKNWNLFYFFIFLSSHEQCPLLIIILYRQIKVSISFWCGKKLNHQKFYL